MHVPSADPALRRDLELTVCGRLFDSALAPDGVLTFGSYKHAGSEKLGGKCALERTTLWHFGNATTEETKGKNRSEQCM